MQKSGRICIDRIFPVSQIWIGNGVCYLESDVYLPEENYCWRVQGINESGVSDWSSWTEFQVTCTDCLLGTYVNTTTAAVFPNGTILEKAPVFEWLAVTGASYYKLSVIGESGENLLDVSVPSANCSLTACTYDPGLILSADQSYSWQISTYGGYDVRWGSAEAAFEVVEEAVSLNDIDFSVPEENGTLDPDVPLIIWTDPGKSTASFGLNICDQNGETLFSGNLSRDDAWCDGMTCSIVFMDIPDGSYRIYITPYSEFNKPGAPVSLSFGRISAEE